MILIKTEKVDKRDLYWFLRHRADVLKCCGNVDNLQIEVFPNKTMRATCIKCGRRHWKMVAEPGGSDAIFGMGR